MINAGNDERDPRVVAAFDEENTGSVIRRINAIRARWFDSLLARVGVQPK